MQDRVAWGIAGLVFLSLFWLLGWSLEPSEIQNEAAPAGANTDNVPVESPENPHVNDITPPEGKPDSVQVVSVVDGDTFKVALDDGVKTVRVIGIDTPETVHPEKPVECFGREASKQAKALLTGQEVSISFDPLVGEQDQYGRLLVYATLPDGRDFGETMIKAGYAYEYTYDGAYEKQALYKAAETIARTARTGLWGEANCTKDEPAVSAETPYITANTSTECVLKGNVNADGERIYHVPGQMHYEKTVIDESKGERWFCSDEQATTAGWRKALQ